MVILLLLSSCIYAEESKSPIETMFYSINSFSGDENKPGRLINIDNAIFACKEIGSKCEKFLLQCLSKAEPYTCLSTEYIEMEISKERCGLSNYESCYEENDKLFNVFLFQISLPNNKKPRWKTAFKECDLNVPSYNVQGKALKEFRDSVIKESQLDSSVFSYIIQEDYNKCFLEHLNKT
jgi:hypothetical protein